MEVERDRPAAPTGSVTGSWTEWRRLGVEGSCGLSTWCPRLLRMPGASGGSVRAVASPSFLTWLLEPALSSISGTLCYSATGYTPKANQPQTACKLHTSSSPC